MKKNPGDPPDAADLRRRAEKRLKSQWSEPSALQPTQQDAQRLLHELQVHQIELELQNEELRRANKAKVVLAQHTDLYDFAPVSYFTLDRVGTVRQVNLPGARLLGVNRSQLMNRRFSLFVSDDFRPIFNSFLKQVFTGQASASCETPILREGHPPFWVHLEAKVAEDGQECRIVVMDITERKQAEEALLQSEKKYREIIEGLNECVFRLSFPDGNYNYISPAVRSVFGYSEEDFLHTPRFVSTIIHPDSAAYIKEKWNDFINDRVHQTLEYKIIDPEGNERWIRQSNKGIYDGNGKIIGAEGICRNITEQKKAEDKIRYQAELLQNVSDAVISSDFDFTIKTWNVAAERIFGWKEHEVINKKVHDVLKIEYINTTSEDALKQLKKNGYWTGDVIERHKDGTPITIYASMNVIKDIAGKEIGVVAINQDITKRKMVEISLRESQKKFQNLIETTGEFIWEMDSQGRYTYCSPQIEKLWGFKPEEMIGKTPFDVMPPGDKEKTLKKFRATGDSPKPFSGMETTAYDSQGRLVFVETNVVPFFDDHGGLLGYRGISWDVTERKKAEQELHSSQEKYKRLFDSSPELIIEVDEDGNILSVNSAMAKNLSVPAEKLIGKNILNLLSKEIGEKRAKIARKALEEGKNLESEDERAGRYFQNIYVPIIHPGGKKTIQLIVRDITNEKKAEHILRESEEKYKTIFNSAGDSIISLDNEGVIVDINDAGIQRIGYERKDLIGKNFSVLDKIIAKESKQYMLKNFQQRKLGIHPPAYEVKLMNRKGEEYYVEINAVPIVKNGKNQGFLAILRDVTERKKADEKLKESEEKWRSITENSPDHIMLLDKEARILFINRPVSDLSKEDVIGKSVYDFTPGEWKKDAANCFKRVLQSSKPDIYHTEYITRDGVSRFFEVHVGPVFMNNEIVALISSSADISERKKTEDAIVQSEKKYREFVNLLPQMVFEIDGHGNFTFINQASIDLTGYTQEEFKKGLNAFQTVAPHDRERIKSNILKVMNGESTSANEYLLQRKDGTTFPAIFSSTPVINESRIVGVRGFAIDITDRKKAEETEKIYLENQLFLSDAVMKLALLPTCDHIFDFVGEKLQMLTKNTYITIVKYDEKTNKFVVYKLFGYSSYMETILKILGRSPVGMKLDYEDDKWRNKFTRGNLEKISEEDFESIILPQMPRNISQHIKKIINFDEIYVIPLIAENKLFGFVFLSAYKDCKVENLETIKTFINQASLAIERKDAEEQVNSQNIQLKNYQREIEQQNIQLKKTDQLKTDFLNITSHELRTPMSAIKGYSQILLKQTLGQINDDQRQALDVVLRNTNRLDRLIQDILDVSRLESGTMKFVVDEIEIRGMLAEVVDTMQPFSGQKQIKINTEIESGIPELIADTERIKQVIINLIDNAVKFSPYGSHINIRVKKQHETVLFEIQDFGRGIPKDKQEKIFDLFYQVDTGADRKFGGAGLGLAISQGIVIASGGKIWVESADGTGSTFYFTLPLRPVEDVERRFSEMDLFGLERKRR